MTRQKLKYRFNFVDLLIIILILAIVGALYYFSFGKPAQNSASGVGVNESCEIKYVLELEKVDKDFLDKIKVGDTVSDAHDGLPLGVISKIASIEPAYIIVQDPLTGQTQKAYYPPINVQPEVQEETSNEEIIEKTAVENEKYDFYNVKIEIVSDVIYTGNSYSVDHISLFVGKSLAFRLPEFEGVGTCVFLDVLK